MSVQELKAVFLHVVKDNYFNLEGRASRYEYWWFVVINLALSVIAALLDKMVGLAIFSGILLLALLLPGLGLSVRRLHDINKSGWWLLLALVPFIGQIVILVWAAQKGDAAANDFGEAPTDDYAKAE